MTNAQAQAAILIRAAKMHAGESTRFALQASLLLNEGKTDLAETVLMRGKVQQALADEAIRQAKEIIGTLEEVK